MSERTMFDRDLVAWMAEETAGGMPERSLTMALEATSRVRPRPAWQARLRQPALRWGSRTAAGTPRRALAFVAILILLALAALAALSAGWRPFQAAVSADWNGYRGGPNRASVADSGPVGLPVLHWRFKAGDSVKDPVVIVGDLVIAPSQDGVLHAIAIGDGSERWRFAPGTSLSAPAVGGGLVYVADGHGRLHALAVETGIERWVSAEVVETVTSPIVEDGQVIVGTGSGDLVALDARTGERHWRVSLATGAVYDPAATPGSVFAGTADGTFFALRSSDGSTIWKHDFGGDPLGTPTVAGSIVYSGSRADVDGGRLRALDMASGKVIWQTDEPWFAPAVKDGLAISGRTDGLIVARDAQTGTERWRFVSGGPTRGPVIYRSTVVFGVDVQGSIVAVDLTTGGFLWRYDIDGSNQCCVAVAKGYVVTGTMSGSIYVIGGDGSSLTPSPAPPVSAPAASTSTPPTQAPSAALSATPSAELPEPYRVVERLGRGATGIGEPLALAIGPNGDVYVTDTSMRVTQIRPNGSIVRWGRPGDGPGAFDFLAAAANANAHGSIAVAPGGNVYVSDSDNHRVQVFTSDGRYLDQFGSLGSDPGQFTIPFDVGVDAQGNVFVADDGLQRLTKFDANGHPIWIADASTDPRLDGHLHTPRIDSQGRIVVANDDRGLVVTLAPDGSVVDAFEAATCGVSIDPGGRDHVVDCSGRGQLLDANHAVVAVTRDLDLITVEFGAHGEIVGLDRSGDVLRLEMAVPGASATP